MRIPVSLVHALCLALLATWSQTATALILTFDEFEAPGTSFIVHPNPLDIGAYRFTASDGVSPTTTPQQSSVLYGGSASLTPANSADLVMERVDGGAFAVASVDLYGFSAGTGTFFEFIGELEAGGTVEQTVEATSALMVILSGFDDIISLTFGVVGPSGFANEGSVDNIDVVPEPASVALAVASLLALTTIARTRRRPGAASRMILP